MAEQLSSLPAVSAWPTRKTPQQRFDEQVQTAMNQMSTMTTSLNSEFIPGVNSVVADVNIVLENLESIKNASNQAAAAQGAAENAAASASAAAEQAARSKEEADRAETAADRAEEITNLRPATKDTLGLVRPQDDFTIDGDGRLFLNSDSVLLTQDTLYGPFIDGPDEIIPCEWGNFNTSASLKYPGAWDKTISVDITTDVPSQYLYYKKKSVPQLSSKYKKGGRFIGLAVSPDRKVALCEVGMASVCINGEWSDSKYFYEGTGKWHGIAFGNGIFVAVGDKGLVASSNDGFVWTEPVSVNGIGSNFVGVTFGNGKFIALADNGYYTTSEDGVVWSEVKQIDSTYTTYYLRVSYIQNKFFVLRGGPSDNFFYSSENGISWDKITIKGLENGTLKYFRDIAFGNGLFVIVVEDSGNCYISTSNDGVVWTSAKKIYDITFRRILFIDTYGFFVLIGDNSNIAIVKDFNKKINNLSIEKHIDSTMYDMVYDNNCITILCRERSIHEIHIYQSNNTESNNDFEFNFFDNMYVQDISYNNEVAISNGDKTQIQSVARGSNNTYLIGGTNGYVGSSTFGCLFSGLLQVPNSTKNLQWSMVRFVHDRFILSSTTGYVCGNNMFNTESRYYNNIGTIGRYTELWNGVAYGNGKYIMVGNKGNITSSIDGISWSTPVTIHDGAFDWADIAYGKSRFVAISKDFFVSTSDDGVIWSEPVHLDGAGNQCNRMIYANNLFVAAGSTICSSEDGIEWYITEDVSRYGDLYTHLAYGNGFFVASCSSSYFVTSYDAKTWSERSRIGNLKTDILGIEFDFGRFIFFLHKGSSQTYMATAESSCIPQYMSLDIPICFFQDHEDDVHGSMVINIKDNKGKTKSITKNFIVKATTAEQEEIQEV